MEKDCATDEKHCEKFGLCSDGTYAKCVVCRGDLCNGERETKKPEPEPEPIKPPETKGLAILYYYEPIVKKDERNGLKIQGNFQSD